MSIQNLLEYRCYAYNRSKNPEFKPELYRHLFENWESYEEKYQGEKPYWDIEAKKGETKCIG